MIITIDAKPEEIAALVLGVQERPSHTELDLKKFVDKFTDQVKAIIDLNLVNFDQAKRD